MASQKEIETKEQPFTRSLSVAGILTYHNNLLMVQDSESMWGIPAGRAKSSENPTQVFKREFSEETGLDSKLIFWQSGYRSSPSVVWVTEEEKTSLGIIYDVGYAGEIGNYEWEIEKEGEEVVSAKLFPVFEILQLVEQDTRIRKPKFNKGQIIKWLVGSFNTEAEYLRNLKDETAARDENIQLVELLRQWILMQYDNGLFYTERDPLLYHYLVYKPPYAIVDRGAMVSIDLEKLLEGPIQVGRRSKQS